MRNLINSFSISHLTKKHLPLIAIIILLSTFGFLFLINKEKPNVHAQIIDIIKSENIDDIEEKLKYEKIFTEHILKIQEKKDDSLIGTVTNFAKDALLKVDAEIHLVVKASFSPNFDNIIIQNQDQSININFGQTMLTDIDINQSKTIISYKKSGILIFKNDQEKSIILETFLNNKDKFKHEMTKEFISSANETIKRHIKRVILERIGSGITININIKENKT
ncbi:hypothetical protein KKC91_01370 [bacterium]|nr:hypothetical protein [bacterium]